jgi:hypothetical protein
MLSNKKNAERKEFCMKKKKNPFVREQNLVKII